MAELAGLLDESDGKEEFAAHGPCGRVARLDQGLRSTGDRLTYTVALDTFEVLTRSGSAPTKGVTAAIDVLREHQHLAIKAFHETAAHRFQVPCSHEKSEDA